MGTTELAPLCNLSCAFSPRTVKGFASGLFVSFLIFYLFVYAGGSDYPSSFAVFSWFLPSSPNVSGWLRPRSLSLKNQTFSEGGDRRLRLGCDIFSGRWIRDNSLPLYDPASCPFVDPTFNCHENGRPDKEFLSWRWQPNDCDIPR